MPTLGATALGVGGATRFIRSAEVSIGVQQHSGRVKLNVLEGEMPFLPPIDFCTILGMDLSVDDGTATWRRLGNRQSQ